MSDMFANSAVTNEASQLPYESAFARTLRNPEAPVPTGVVGDGYATRERRFAVHRNNVVAGLVGILRGKFPAIEKLVGEEFFTAMAHAFVVQQPPRSPVLSAYGDDFPAFIAAFEPARGLTYLPDVARLEAGRTRAYHAADAAPLDAAAFAALDPERLDALGLTLHPSVEIVRSNYPIVTIWAMNCGERVLAPIEDWRGENALVIRPRLDVEVRLLPPGGACFLLALASGRPLAEAVQAALADAPDFDLTRNLAGLIEAGVVAAIIPPEA